MTEAAVDHSEALEEARNRDLQMPNAQQSHPADLHMHGATDNYSQNSQSGDHVGSLAAARKSGGNLQSIKNAANMAKSVAETATPMGALSLFKQIDFLGDMPFVAALGAALLKDLLDFVAGPTVVLSILFSALCSIFIFMMMLLAGANGKKKGASKFLSKLGILGVGGIADSIPGVDFLPIESITVAAIYVLTLLERKNAQK
ncbi:MAG: hypothetical protein HGA36_01095 [Candidatus Moranbacteria bacterium]|nr:hypothetical protein [Candidatus Moranbacteria bacterium]